MIQTHSVWCNKHHSDTVRTSKVHKHQLGTVWIRYVHRASRWASGNNVTNAIISEHNYISISISINAASASYTLSWHNKHHCDTVQTKKVNSITTSAGTGDVSNDIISKHKYISFSVTVASIWYRHTKLDATSIILIQYRPEKSTAYQHQPVQAMWGITSLVSISIFRSA
jgi:hypothetical protein